MSETKGAVREGGAVSSGHSAGPWEIGHRGRNVNLIAQPSRGDDKYIAQVYGIPQNSTLADLEGDSRWAVGLANAALIAAAPDLLAALVAVLEAIGDGGDFDYVTGDPDLYQTARAAIRKARAQTIEQPKVEPK